MTRRLPITWWLASAVALLIYLWPSVAGPVVMWSDSTTDIEWAKEGKGIWSPASAPDHTAKPGYLLFLRMALAMSGSPRGIVIIQSVLVFAAIGAASILVGRRLGFGSGLAVFGVEVLFLRLRDSTSSVMSEPLAAALFLLVVALLLEPPRRTAALVACGLAVGFLVLVRPNVGAIAAVLAAARLAVDRRWRALLGLGFAAAALVLPVWLATSPREGAAPRDLAYQRREARADDLWIPSPGVTTPSSVLARGGPDRVRQIVWRLTHGLLGTEFYDARWSEPYRAATTISRLATPFLILAAIAVFFVVPRRGRPFQVLGLLLVALAVAQSLVIGSLPRYVLPLLPALVALGVCAAATLRGAGAWRFAGAAVVAFAATLFLRRNPSGLGWEWGRIEAAGVSIAQPIPRDSLPRRSPATLHVRIAAPRLPSGAGIEVRGDGALLPASTDAGTRERPEISVPLPQDLLDANRNGPVTLTFLSTGAYGPNDYLLFPVIPPPWRTRATREPGGDLSPSTGLASGALDWWAHEGAP